MSDDAQFQTSTPATPPASLNVALDELDTLNGSATSAPKPKAQRVKILHGADGVGTDVSSSSPLPVSVGSALPAGTNVIGSVDLAAATPTAIAEAATVSATKYVGISVSETTGSATAKVRVRNANAAGTILDTITLQGNESVSHTYPRGRSAASGTVYVQVVSGAVEGSVFTQ